MSPGEVWTEKYRPANLDEYRGNSSTAQEVKDWVRNWTNRASDALLLHGPPGVGKTALVNAVANELDMELFETNASDVRTKQAIREKVEQAVKQRSFSGKTKLILIDEIDGMSSSDRGGRSAINDLISESRFPVILTANDAYANGMQAIRRKSKTIEISSVHTNSIAAELRDILDAEGIEYEDGACKALARRAGGDMRSAINDLQSLAEKHGRITKDHIKDLSHRDREQEIFDALKVVFKTMTAENASNALDDLSEDTDEVLQWLRENIPAEYEDSGDVAEAMDYIAKADLFQGRIRKDQHWSLLKYVYELMSVGVALSKDEKYSGFTRYSYPSRIKQMGRSKSLRKKRDDIGEKIGEELHISISHATDMLPFLQLLFQNPEWQQNIVEELGLTEDEVEFINDF